MKIMGGGWCTEAVSGADPSRSRGAESQRASDAATKAGGSSSLVMF